MAKAQGSLEYLIIISAVLAIAAIVVLYLTGVFGGQVSTVSIGSCKQATVDCKASRMISPNDPCLACNSSCKDLTTGKEIFPNATLCCVQARAEMIYADSPGCGGVAPGQVCGNNIKEGIEQCDGTDATACPGQCRANCTCPSAPGLTISLVPPTPNDGASQAQDSVYVNVSSDSGGFNHYTILDWNRTLVGWWRLDGNTRDNITGTLGTITGSPSAVAGAFGQAYSFNGVTDYITLGTGLYNYPNVTICAWFKTGTASTTAQRVVTSGSENSNLWALTLGGSQKYICMANQSASYPTACSNALVNDNNWHLACGVSNPNLIYVDGVLQSNPYSSSWGFTANAKVGSRTDNYFFNGTIDDVKIFNRVLSLQEIRALYNANTYQYYNNFTNLGSGAYTYKAYAVNSSGTVRETEQRTVTISTGGAPTLSSVAISGVSNIQVGTTDSDITCTATSINGNVQANISLQYNNSVAWTSAWINLNATNTATNVRYNTALGTNPRWGQTVTTSGTTATFAVDGLVVSSGNQFRCNASVGPIDAPVNSIISSIATMTISSTPPPVGARLTVVGTHLAIGGVTVNPSVPIIDGVDDTTVLQWMILAYINGKPQYSGWNQNFPTAAAWQTNNNYTCYSVDDCWDKYFRLMKYYSLTMLRVGGGNTWGTDIMFKAWLNNRTLFYSVLDSMADNAQEYGIYVTLNLAGTQDFPAYMFGANGDAFSAANTAFNTSSAAYANFTKYANDVMKQMNASAGIGVIDLWNEPDHDKVYKRYWNNDTYFAAGTGRVNFTTWGTKLAQDTAIYADNGANFHPRVLGAACQGMMFGWGQSNFNACTGSIPFEINSRHYYSKANDTYLFTNPEAWSDATGKPLFWNELGYSDYPTVWPEAYWPFAETNINASGGQAFCWMALNLYPNYPYTGLIDSTHP